MMSKACTVPDVEPEAQKGLEQGGFAIRLHRHLFF